MTIEGWNCTTYCQLKNIPSYCILKSANCSVNYTQALDLDSEILFDNVSQILEISKEEVYEIQVSWLPAVGSPFGKFFMIELN